MIGMIRCKKRELKSDPYTYGELYIEDIIVSVKKDVYLNHHIGDVVEYDYTNHVSFSGVLFHNLNHINKIGYDSINADSTVITVKANHQEIEFYDAQSSKFFFWIKVAFMSFLFFFVEMYFLARFDLDSIIQRFFETTSFLPLIFLVFFTLNFVIFSPLLKRRKFQKLKSLEKTTFQAPIVEFIQEQDSDKCFLSYIDKGQMQQLQITMDNFHQIKTHRLVEISLLNHHCFYKIVGI
jgi:hypothetical protein